MAIQQEKIYCGDRTIDGINVTVDGEPLNPRTDLKCFCALGFEWTYEGDAPLQLALAIVADHLQDDNRALRLAEQFMRTIVANFDNTWTLTSASVEAAIQALETS